MLNRKNSQTIRSRYLTSVIYYKLEFWACVLVPMAQVLKHNYRTQHDGRSLIGPIGFPFGFTETGHYNLTVWDFDLSVGVHADYEDPGLYHAGFGYGDGYRR